MTGSTVDILLVEDSPSDARLMREAFSEATIANRLSIVGDGVEALAYLRAEGQYAGRARPDLILLDLNLPKKDGRQVLREIKNDPALLRIPVVVLTTSDAESDVLAAYDNHANCYIRKPIDFGSFARVIHSVEEFWLKSVRLPENGRS